MHVTTEQQENYVIDLHIELPPERFEAEWKRIAQEYVRLARIPGFRKGKAPLAAIEKKYGPDIEKEALEKTIKKAVSDVIREKEMRFLGSPILKKQELEEDKTLRLTVTIIIEPEIELPEYRGLVLSVEKEMEPEARLDELLERVRSDFAEFLNITDRALTMGDYGVLDYSGTVEGKALLEIDPNLPLSIVGGKNRWMHLSGEPLIPGLSESLVGMQPQESRTCDITFPADFSTTTLRDLKVTYEITLHEIKIKQPAPLDNALASRIKPGLTLEELRTSMRDILVQEAEETFRKKSIAALIERLIESMSIELPSLLLEEETTRILRKIVLEHLSHDTAEDEIRAKHDELRPIAQQEAEKKLQLHFILHAIAAKEKIQLTSQDLRAYLADLAKKYQMTEKKLVSELQKNHALAGIQEELLTQKTLDFLVSQAQVTAIPVSKNNDGSTHPHPTTPHVHGPGCHH